MFKRKRFLYVLSALMLLSTNAFGDFTKSQRNRIAQAEKKCKQLGGVAGIERAESSDPGEICYKHVCKAENTHSTTNLTEYIHTQYIGCKTEEEIADWTINGDGDIDVDWSGGDILDAGGSGKIRITINGQKYTLSPGMACYNKCKKNPYGKRCKKCLGVSVSGGGGGDFDLDCPVDVDVKDCISESQYNMIVSGMYDTNCVSCKQHWLSGLAEVFGAAGPWAAQIVGSIQGRKAFESMMNTQAYGWDLCAGAQSDYLNYAQAQQNQYMTYNTDQSGPYITSNQWNDMTVSPDQFNGMNCNGFNMNLFAGGAGLQAGVWGNTYGNPMLAMGYNSQFLAGAQGPWGQWGGQAYPWGGGPWGSGGGTVPWGGNGWSNGGGAWQGGGWSGGGGWMNGGGGWMNGGGGWMNGGGGWMNGGGGWMNGGGVGTAIGYAILNGGGGGWNGGGWNGGGWNGGGGGWNGGGGGWNGGGWNGGGWNGGGWNGGGWNGGGGGWASAGGGGWNGGGGSWQGGGNGWNGGGWNGGGNSWGNGVGQAVGNGWANGGGGNPQADWYASNQGMYQDWMYQQMGVQQQFNFLGGGGGNWAGGGNFNGNVGFYPPNIGFGINLGGRMW